jgi:mannan endo-1,4-beta-mannosidase
MLSLAGDKPIALAEVGAMPTAEVIAQQPRWAYFMMWSGLAESSNSPELLQTNFHSPTLLTRGDVMLPTPPPAPTNYVIAKLAEPVSHNATVEAKALLMQLSQAVGATILSGQQNGLQIGSSSPAASTDQVFAATGRYPAIYGADLAGSKQSRQDVIDEAKRQHMAKSMVSLSWSEPLPAEVPTESNDRALTNFEWSELLTPGTRLNLWWVAQVDVIAGALKQLQDANVAVLWNPYPEFKGQRYWWAGHAGLHRSAELYRMLFDRLVNHDHLGNLIWVWTTDQAGFAAEENGAYAEYPGLLYTDALVLQIDRADGRFRGDSALRLFSGGKVVGVNFQNFVPETSFFARQNQWAWFLLGTPIAASEGTAEALRNLYEGSRIVSRENGDRSSPADGSGLGLR